MSIGHDVPPQADITRLNLVAAKVADAMREIEAAAALLLDGVTEGSPDATDLYLGAWQRLTQWKDVGPNPNDIAPTTEWTGGDTKITGRGCVDRWPRGWGLPVPPEPR